MKELDEKIISWKFTCLDLASKMTEKEGDSNLDSDNIIETANKFYKFLTEGLNLSKSNDEPPF